MKLRNIFTLFLGAGIIMSACTPEQDVSPVDPVDDNPTVTITPGGDYSNVEEGDVLTFEITLDKPIQQPLTFDVVLAEGSTADADDFVTEGATIAAFTTSATVEVVVAADPELEDGETLSFTIVPDFHWDFQVNAEGIKEPVASAAIEDLTFTLDWSAGTYDGSDLCEWYVDLDLIVLNDAETAGTFAGATGACPVEYSNLGLADDTYNIYVQLYNADSIPPLANASIPYVVSFNKGAFSIEGEFSSEDANKTTHYVGQVAIAAGKHTVYDESGAEIGSF